MARYTKQYFQKFFDNHTYEEDTLIEITRKEFLEFNNALNSALIPFTLKIGNIKKSFTGVNYISVAINDVMYHPRVLCDLRYSDDEGIFIESFGFVMGILDKATSQGMKYYLIYLDLA